MSVNKIISLLRHFFKTQLKSKKYAIKKYKLTIYSNISYRLDNNMLDTFLDVVPITIMVGIIYVIYKII